MGDCQCRGAGVAASLDPRLRYTTTAWEQAIAMPYKLHCPAVLACRLASRMILAYERSSPRVRLQGRFFSTPLSMVPEARPPEADSLGKNSIPDPSIPVLSMFTSLRLHARAHGISSLCPFCLLLFVTS
jgi:hypothetical protein